LTAKDNISLLFHKAQTDTSDRETDTAQREQREYGGKRRFSHQRQSSSMTQSNKLKASEAIQSFFADFIKLHSILYLKTRYISLFIHYYCVNN
jgi:hypothetical protein